MFLKNSKSKSTFICDVDLFYVVFHNCLPSCSSKLKLQSVIHLLLKEVLGLLTFENDAPF